MVFIMASLLVIFFCCLAWASLRPGEAGGAAGQAKDNGLGPVKNLTLGAIDKGLADKARRCSRTVRNVPRPRRGKTGPALGNVPARSRPARHELPAEH